MVETGRFLEKSLTHSQSDIRSEQCSIVINHESAPRNTLDHFSDVFSQREIDIDKKYVEKIKKNLNTKDSLLYSPEELEICKQSKERSLALEIIVAEQIELNNWFGENSLFFRTTEYDDLVNSTDAVVVFVLEDETHRIALAIDSTSTAGIDNLRAKIDRNIAKVLNGKLEIKYFESQIDGYKGSIKGILPVVIGLENGNTDNLINLFSIMINSNERKDDQSLSQNDRVISNQIFVNTRKEIIRHPAQLIFLKEIESQLNMYKKIISKENNPNIPVKISDIESISKIIKGIINEKYDISQTPEILFLEKNDAVYNLLEYFSVSKR